MRHEDTAAVYGSGKLEVFATPAMVGLMENTAIKCLEGMLEAENDTVGIEINVKHVKATPVGKKVGCKATITETEGRRIRFEIEAWDETATIGDEVTVKTAVGRLVKGTLIDEAPYYTHSYGKFVPEIIEIDRQLREIMNFGGEE